eukprot:scaffold353978_cov36-Prasinocladus_malaysianus.AAC.1
MQLRHPAIATCREYFVENGFLYIITELPAAGCLTAKVESLGNLTENECRQVLRRILSALAFLHSSGTTHQDVKLDNL